MPIHWFPDNSLICNFAAVDQLGLLRTSLHGSGRIVEAVEYEIERSSAHVPHLRGLDTNEWFGDAISFQDEKTSGRSRACVGSASAATTNVHSNTSERARPCTCSGPAQSSRGASG